MNRLDLGAVTKVFLTTLAGFSLTAGTATAQTVTFTGAGQLPGGTSSRFYEVSADGSVAVGEAVNSSGEKVAVICDLSAGSPVLVPLGFLPGAATNESMGRGVGINSTGTVYVSGTAKNASSLDRAFVWSGTRAGAGSMTAIDLLPGGETNGNKATGERLHVTLTDEVIVTGKSTCGAIGNWPASNYGMAFRYKVVANDLEACGYMVDETAGTRSSGFDVGYREGESYPIYIVGWGDGVWGGTPGGTRPQAFKYHYYNGNYGCWPQRGLDLIVDADIFQYSAGPDGEADTQANGDNIQVKPVGTTGLLAPDAVVVTGGPDHHLKDQLHPADDDIPWPVEIDNTAYAQSFNYAISSNCRYQVGKSTYPDSPYYENDNCGHCVNCPGGWPRQAFLRDVHNREEGDDASQSGGKAFHWPLGFLPGDNNSSAQGVSNGAGYDKTASRDGLVVVGWSQKQLPEIRAGNDGDVDTAKVPGSDDEQLYPAGTTGLPSSTPVLRPGPNGVLDTPAATGDSYGWYDVNSQRAFVCFIDGGLDRAFLKHLGAAPGDEGASAASQFKDMKDLKVWLQGLGQDMTGWELREALGVSDDGQVIVGWGIHNGIEEGFTIKITPAPPTGACCICAPGVPECSCTVTTRVDCENDLLGTYQGDDTACQTTHCCHEPFADVDGDADVDQSDFAFFQACFTGQGAPSSGSLCKCLDRDNSGAGDGDIDSDDWAAFEVTATGPGIPAVAP